MRNSLLQIADTYFTGQGYEQLELVKHIDDPKSSDSAYSDFERRLILSAYLDIIPAGKFMIINNKTNLIHEMGKIRNMNLMLIDIQQRSLEPNMNRLHEMVKSCENFYLTFFEVQVKTKSKHHYQIVDIKNRMILGDYQIKHYPRVGWIIIGNALSEPKFSSIKNLQ